MVIRNAQVMDPETGLNEVLDIRIQNGLIGDISDSLRRRTKK